MDQLAPARLRRFARPTRALHWLNAAATLALVITGLLTYLPSVKAVEAGGYRLAPLLHVIAGVLFLAAPLLTLLLAPPRRALLSDLRRALTPTPDDPRWLRWASLALLGAKLRPPRTGKFNAGQKLNSAFWLAAWLWLGGTGAVLAIYFFDRSRLSADLAGRAFTWHENVALLSLAPLAGHLYLALLNRDTRPALAGIVGGDVDAAWAHEHHALWAEQGGG